MLSVETRCPVDPDAPVAWKPGDVNRFFADLATNPDIQKYEPNILSRPDYTDGDQRGDCELQTGIMGHHLGQLYQRRGSRSLDRARLRGKLRAQL